jgi:hypothetical protein
MLIKQNSTTVTGWTEIYGTYSATNEYRYYIPPNYLITQTVAISTQYLFKYQIIWTGNYDNGFNMGGTGVSKFIIETYAGAWQEVGLLDFVSYPSPYVITIKNRYTAAGKPTVLDLFWVSNIDIYPGYTLVVNFDTNNLLYQMFANDLEGVGTNGATYRYLDCR